MIVIVLGMHKSGTTMIAKALHEAGINMGPNSEGTYKKNKYEDPQFAEINHLILGRTKKRFSLDIPGEAITDDYDINRLCYGYGLSRRGGDWGAKHPDTTLTYGVWREHLPKHITIGVYRPLEYIINHYYKNMPNKIKSVEQIERAYNYYNSKLFAYKIPIVHYTKILEDGFGELEKLLNIKIPDVRTAGKTE